MEFGQKSTDADSPRVTIQSDSRDYLDRLYAENYSPTIDVS